LFEQIAEPGVVAEEYLRHLVGFGVVYAVTGVQGLEVVFAEELVVDD
jgi:hypothetical protein